MNREDYNHEGNNTLNSVKLTVSYNQVFECIRDLAEIFNMNGTKGFYYIDLCTKQVWETSEDLNLTGLC